MMKSPFPFLILVGLLCFTLACNLSVNSGTGGQNTAPADPNRPQVAFVAPQTGAKYAAGAPILLYAQASDSQGISRVEFYDNFETLISSVEVPNGPQPSFLAQHLWTPPSAQTHILRVQAFRADGVGSPAAEVVIEVVDLPAGVNLPQAALSAESAPQPSPEVQAAATLAPSPDPSTPAAAPDAGAGGGEAPPPAPEITATPSPSPVTSLNARVDVEATNVRVAPSVNAQMAMTPLQSGDQVVLVWQSSDNLWYAIELPTGGYGWIFSESLQVEGDPSTLPLADTQ